MIHTERFQFPTVGNSEMHDLTGRVSAAVAESGCRAGIVTVFVAHSTAAIAISEFEPGLREDIRPLLDRLVPPGGSYAHNRLNHDDNAHSHLRSTLLGPSVTVPFADGRLCLGVWQQIVLIDFDTRARNRDVVIQVMGE